MSYREVAMWEVLNVLRRIGRGESKSAVARTTGHDRKTIGRYVAVALELGWQPGRDEPTETLAAAVAARHSPGRDRGPGEAEALLLPHRERIKKWLKPEERELGQKRGLRLTKVHTLLARQGIVVPYSSLHRFAVNHCGFGERQRLTVRMAESAPGEVAEVDFGRLGLVPYPPSGGRRVLWALVVVLVFSRHQFVFVTHEQTIPRLIGGLEDAWTFLGGVSRRVVVDNLKAAVTKADRYDPAFERTFEEYAAHRGFTIDPAPPRMPTGKPSSSDRFPTSGTPSSGARPGATATTSRSRPSAGVSRPPACGSTAPPASGPWSSSRTRSATSSCRSFASATTRPPGPSAPSIPTTTSSSRRRSTLRPRVTSARRSRSAATASSCASTPRAS